VKRPMWFHRNETMNAAPFHIQIQCDRGLPRSLRRLAAPANHLPRGDTTVAAHEGLNARSGCRDGPGRTDALFGDTPAKRVREVHRTLSLWRGLGSSSPSAFYWLASPAHWCYSELSPFANGVRRDN
jgi:hypothetical protein